jgi:hypothetical protein
MADMKLVYSFRTARDLIFVKALLDAEEIPYFLKDELTIQTLPFFSSTFGGIKLFCKPEHAERVHQLLLDEGLIEPVSEEPGMPGDLERLTQRIPLLNRLIFPLRIPILFSLLAAIPLYVLFRLEVPTLSDELTDSTWCVQAAAHEGQSINILTIPTAPLFLNNCREIASFNKNGTVELPGINGPKISARWRKMGRQIEIYQTYPPQPEYEGVYKVRQGVEYMILQSHQIELQIEKLFKGIHHY